MIRQKIKANHPSNGFKLRGLDHTRIEGLSDGVFAIAIALLLISADVPEKMSELIEFLKDLVPFAATIVLLMVIWYQHYIFFIRYGLRDAKVVAINTIVLFLILFYVYPLKFLFKTLFTLFGGMLTRDQEALDLLFTETMPYQEAPSLMVIYGFGAALIFISLAMLYLYALSKMKELELTKIEVFETKTSININLLLALVPVFSLIIAYFNLAGNHTFMVSGFTYFLYPIILPIYGARREKKMNLLLSSLE